VKLGRNDPCWCGSNIKYKKCHLNREQQQAPDKSAIHKEINRFNSYKKCSASTILQHQCSNKIVKAHSISKSSSLKYISVDGHVLTFFMAQRAKGNTEIEPVEIGINKASTFTGFCSFHDKSLFSPFEDSPFDLSNHQCFLIMYRTVARELFTKESCQNMFGLVKDMDKGRDVFEQIYIQDRYHHFNGSNELTIADLNSIKRSLESMMLSKDYSQLEHAIFRLDRPPNVMASAIGGVSFGFDGSLVQEIVNDPNRTPDYLCMNSFASDGKGYIVFSWLAEHKTTNNKIIESLINTSSIPDSILMLLISHVENIYLSPSWWTGLSEVSKSEITELYKCGGMKDTYNDVLITNKNYGAFEYNDFILLYS